MSPVGPEGTVKDDGAFGHLISERQGQEDLRRDSLQSQSRGISKAEPLVVGRLTHQNAPLASPGLQQREPFAD